MMTKSATISMPVDDADLYPIGKVIPFRITSDRTVNGTVSEKRVTDRCAEVTVVFDEEIDIPTDEMTPPHFAKIKRCVECEHYVAGHWYQDCLLVHFKPSICSKYNKVIDHPEMSVCDDCKVIG